MSAFLCIARKLAAIAKGVDFPLSEHDKTVQGQKESESSGPVFREKSLAHVTAWKYSRAYLKGSGPVVWMAGAAILIILIAIFIWTSFASPYYLISILSGGVLG